MLNMRQAKNSSGDLGGFNVGHGRERGPTHRCTPRPAPYLREWALRGSMRWGWSSPDNTYLEIGLTSELTRNYLYCNPVLSYIVITYRIATLKRLAMPGPSFAAKCRIH